MKRSKLFPRTWGFRPIGSSVNYLSQIFRSINVCMCARVLPDPTHGRVGMGDSRKMCESVSDYVYFAIDVQMTRKMI